MERKKTEHKTYAEHRKGMMHEMRPKHEGMKAEKRPEMRAHKKEGEAIKRVEKAHKMEGEKMASRKGGEESPKAMPVEKRNAMAEKMSEMNHMKGVKKAADGMKLQTEAGHKEASMGKSTRSMRVEHVHIHVHRKG